MLQIDDVDLARQLVELVRHTIQYVAVMAHYGSQVTIIAGSSFVTIATGLCAGCRLTLS